MKRKKLVLIDGHAIIHRAFHAVPEDLVTSSGEPVNATFGFTSMLMKALLEEKPDYVAVTFDRPTPTFRHLEYTPYKAHRPPLPDTMKPQFARIHEVVEALGIQIYEQDGFEADDVLGTLSVQARQLSVDTVIYTGDMDTLQLVNEAVLVKVARRGITEVIAYDDDEVYARYGFVPARLPDFKGLVGDKSDNIPGVAGIGEKTALRLLEQYSDLDGVLAHVDELKPRDQRLLRDAADQARLSKYLATIILTVPVQLDLDTCRLTHLNTERVVTLFRQLEFRTLIERVFALFQQLGLAVSQAELAAQIGAGSEQSSATAESDLLYAPPVGVVTVLPPPLPPGQTDAPDALLPDSIAATATNEHSVQDVAVAVSPEEHAEDVPLQLSLFEVETPYVEQVQKLHLPDPVSSATSLFLDEETKPQTRTQVVDTEEAMRLLIRAISAAGCVAVDTETTSEEPRRAELVGISLCIVPGEAYYIPVGHVTTLDGQEPGPQLARAYVLEKLKPLLEDEAIQKYMHNAKYDMAMFWRNGIEVRGLAFDTMLAAYLVDPGRRGLGLKDQAFQRLGQLMTPITDLIGSGSKMISIARVAVRRVADYAGADADMTYRLVQPLRDLLQQHDLLTLFHRVELPLVPVLMHMELTGVALDADFLREYGTVMEEQIEQLERAIYTAVGHHFNINSTKQLADVLFVELKLPTGKKTKTGYSVNADVIEALRGKHSVVDYLLEYRQLNKLKSTYVDGLLTLMDPQTGRVYTSFNQTIASSGRLSSSNPNLQNIPVRTELGRQIRRAFLADPSYLLLTADYAQFELRILAHITHEPRLIEAFSHNEDIHTSTASSLFGVPVEDVTKEQRRLAKTVVFAVLYGQSAFGLSQVTGMTNSDAAEFIKRYHETFPTVKSYVDSTLRQARSQGYVNTLYGRKRFFPEMQALSHVERQALEREAINMPIQGSNADLIKVAMVRLHHALRERRMRTRMILQVHDELVFEVPVEEVEQARQLVRSMMENVEKLDVPILVEMKLGKNWYEAEPLVR